MSFIWPAMLLLLLLVPLLVMWYVVLFRRRQRVLARFGNMWLGQVAGRNRFTIRRHIPPVLFLLSITVMIIALARPQAEVNLPRLAGTVILAFDVSGSMAADDMKPTRMDAAKTAAKDFIERQPPYVQIGVVAFSDSGVSVQAPTNEQGAVLAAINRLTPQRGTSVANGILASLTALETVGQNTRYYSNLTPTPELTPTPMPRGTYTSGVIVLLTDGENNENPDPLAAAQAAIDRGVRIFTVGIGSAAGTNLKINGFNVHTQLDEATLQQIAQLTDGTYYNAETEQDLLKIYDNLNPQLEVKPQMLEITPIFAGASIFFLLFGGVFSLLWFSRLP